jgi:hypothetical protein
VFLHLEGYAVHVVHSDASGPRNVDILFFMLGWAHTVSTKCAPGHVTLSLFLCIRWDPGSEISMHYFLCSGGPDAVSIKSVPGHVMPNMSFFTSGGIYGSRSAFWWIRGTKCRSTIFCARVGLVRFPKK